MYSYIYFSVIIGFMLSIIALFLYLLMFILYNTALFSSGFIGIITILALMSFYTFIKKKYVDGEL